MRFLLLVTLFCMSLFSAQLTPAQLQLIQSSGYSQEDINKALSATTKEDVAEKKEQIIENKLDLGNKLDSDYKINPDKKMNLENKKLKQKEDPLFETEIKLEKYGSQFFKNKNNINPYSIPTPQNYMLNYADKLSITIFGGQNQKFSLPINKDGNITIPQVGEIRVFGLSFEEAKELIIDETKKAYPNSTNILVDISEFSSIQVIVTGLVSAPGLYNLTSFSTIKDALINSGEILNSGSYRNISVKRDGKVIKSFDLYNLIRYGNSSSDTVLKNADIIVVNPVKTEVSLKGEINNPAIYELNNQESFKNLFDFASGLSAKANKNAIKLKRYVNNSIKVYTLSLSDLYKMTPSNGDEIEIFSLSDQNANLVKITGNVIVFGEKELPKDRSLSTLLNNELNIFGANGFFKTNTNYQYALIKNVDSIKSFNLRNVLDRKTDVTLESGDEINILNKYDLKDKPYIFAKGDIVDKQDNKMEQNENIAELSSTEEFGQEKSLKDLKTKELTEAQKLKNAKINENLKTNNSSEVENSDKAENFEKVEFYEGLKAKNLFDIVKFKTEKNGSAYYVDKSKIQISRLENNQNISKLINIQENPNFEIKAFDEIVFFDFYKINERKRATIKGEIFIPGTYNINEKSTINDLVKIAGGVTKKTLMNKCEVARYEIKDNKRIRTILSLDLGKAIDLNLQVFEDDEWSIFAIENWNEKKYVELKGEIRFPGKYNISEGEKLSSVLSRAGGFTNHAFVEGSVFTREEVKQLQIKRLEESLGRLKAKAMQSNASANEAGENSKDKQNMVLAVAQLEKEAASKAPIGRISLDLYYDLARFQNSVHDISLKDLDTLYVPSINDTISVVGEVLNQNTFVYDGESDAKDYLEKAGGSTELADEEYIYIVKANGEAKKIQNDYFWGNSNDVFKGDTIIVPMKLDTVSDIAFTKDVTQILYQLAITAASLKTVGGI